MRSLAASVSMAAALAMASGCADNSPDPSAGKGGADGGRGVSASYLCVGMERSRRFGACPGCEKDVVSLSAHMRHLGYSGVTLVSSDATKSNVVERLRAGIEATPADGLFLFFYSGHGGQEDLGGGEPDGSDALDEYLCLYDTYMSDDEIWSLVSRCRGRVFMYFDACHSSTMYRSVASLELAGAPVAVPLGVGDGSDLIRSGGFTFRPEKFAEAAPMSRSPMSGPRILCWSGCLESEYSYGGSGGGVLTTCVMRHVGSCRTYDDLWDRACRDVQSLQPGQHPARTYIGGFPRRLEAFR